MPEELAGVNSPDVAGQETEEDVFAVEGLETGEEDIESEADSEDTDSETEAEPEEEEASEESPDNPKSKVGQAFAKRLAAERQKMSKELKQELTAEFEAKYGAKEVPQTQQAMPDDLYSDMPKMTREQVDHFADQMGMTPEAAWSILCQQHAMNKLNQKLQNQQLTAKQLQEATAKTDAMREVAAQRKKNPNLPAFDEARITQIRADYRKEMGVELPWKAAYKQLVAEEVLSGKTSRAAEQKVLNNIGNRDAKTVNAGKGGKPKVISIDDMTEAQFEKFQADVASGKYLSKEGRAKRQSY
jgi:hypothetical protein